MYHLLQLMKDISFFKEKQPKSSLKETRTVHLSQCPQYNMNLESGRNNSPNSGRNDSG